MFVKQRARCRKVRGQADQLRRTPVVCNTFTRLVTSLYMICTRVLIYRTVNALMAEAREIRLYMSAVSPSPLKRHELLFDCGRLVAD